MEFTALIANLGKYAAGIVAETPLAFPTTTEQVQKALQTIGVDGLKYEEVIVKEYSIGIAGVAPLLGEYAHIDELNYLAAGMSFTGGSEEVCCCCAPRRICLQCPGLNQSRLSL